MVPSKPAPSRPVSGVCQSGPLGVATVDCGADVRGLVVDPLQQVARLAVQDPAHGFQRAEAHRLRAAVLQDRDVRRREADPLGELADAHLALGQLDVDAHHDRHQITASMSVRSVVALRSRARITTTTSPTTVTVATTRSINIGMPGSSALTPTKRNTPTSTSQPAPMAHRIASTQTIEPGVKMRSSFTSVSSCHVATRTTCTHSTRNTAIAVTGHRRCACSGSSRAIAANWPGSDKVWKTTSTANNPTRNTRRAATARDSVNMHRVSLGIYRKSIGSDFRLVRCRQCGTSVPANWVSTVRYDRRPAGGRASQFYQDVGKAGMSSTDTGTELLDRLALVLARGPGGGAGGGGAGGGGG